MSAQTASQKRLNAKQNYDAYLANCLAGNYSTASPTSGSPSSLPLSGAPTQTS
jgi:hypothetical protein